MTDSDILTMLKTDLEISVSTRDTYLGQLITLSKKAIEREGIDFDETLSVEDGSLIEMYAAYLYRKRTDGAMMPRQLRYMLNNRLLQEKAQILDESEDEDDN